MVYGGQALSFPLTSRWAHWALKATRSRSERNKQGDGAGFIHRLMAHQRTVSDPTLKVSRSVNENHPLTKTEREKRHNARSNQLGFLSSSALTLGWRAEPSQHAAEERKEKASAIWRGSDWTVWLSCCSLQQSVSIFPQCFLPLLGLLRYFYIPASAWLLSIN
jgi:hypothetical protein